MREEREYLDILQKTLQTQKEGLYSSLPKKRFSRKTVNKPLQCEATVQLQNQRKIFLNVMQKTLLAREKNKYLATAQNMNDAQNAMREKAINAVKHQVEKDKKVK